MTVSPAAMVLAGHGEHHRVGVGGVDRDAAGLTAVPPSTVTSNASEAGAEPLVSRSSSNTMSMVAPSAGHRAEDTVGAVVSPAMGVSDASALQGPSPASFPARTRTVYSVSLVRPVISWSVASAAGVADCPAVGGLSPGLGGGFHSTCSP